jgi:putative ABC transport system permease protein
VCADSHKDHGREARGPRAFDNLRISALDLKLGGRMLVKHPGLTIIGTMAVAFAIGVGSVAFEIMTQVVFPTIPLPDGDKIVALRNWNVVANGPVGPSRRDYALWKTDLTTITDIGAIVLQDRNIAVSAGAGEPVSVADVTASTFAVTRVPALMGRTFLPVDERADAADVVVVGYDFWKDKLGGGADVVGRLIRISGAPARIVGVMPRGYAFPRRNAVWRPLHLERLPEASPRLWFVFGRLAPDRTLADANAELASIGARTAASFPETHRNLRAQVISLPDQIAAVSPEEWMILGSINVFLVILLALVCGNVALLLFARAASRQTEIVVRAALGASRGRIIMQLFAEALVLCVVGATVGLVASNVLLQWLWTIAEGQRGALPFWMGTSLSPTTVLYAVALTLLAAVIAGVVPALKVTSAGFDARLRAMSSGGGGLHFGGVWTGIIVAQIALTVTLPMVTSFIRGDFVRARDVHAGFAASEFLTATLALDRLEGAMAGGDTTPVARAARLQARYEALADRLRAEPAVAGVTYANRLPLMHHGPRTIEMDPGPAGPRSPFCPEGHCAGSAAIDPRFFDVVGAPVVRGRALTSADAAQRTQAALVNENFVKYVMGGRNPIGRQVRFLSPEGRRAVAGEKPGPWYEIVGVVPNLGIPDTEGLDHARIYFAALPKETGPLRVAVHVRGDPQRFVTRARELAAAIDPALRVINPRPLPRVIDTEVEYIGFWYRLLAGFAGVALVLSLAGVYAVMAFAVAKRTREIGVRVALGARPRQIILTVFKRPLIQIALGIAVGGIMAGTIVSAGNSDLRLETLGPAAIFVVAIGVCCVLACIVPTRRALRIQPTEALKDEG